MNLPQVGDVGHVRHLDIVSKWNISALIHCALNIWHRDWCKRHLKVYKEVKGTHDFLIVPCEESGFGIGAGESLASKGTVITPWENYMKLCHAGKAEVWIFDPKFTEAERDKVVEYWMKNCKGTAYDYKGILSILWKVMFSSFSDKVRQSESRFWCTEALAVSLRSVRDVLQARFATPMHIEQCCGWLARPERMQTTLWLRFCEREDEA